ncbi:enoyl-CoA hydratase-related protein [Marinospirillum alkaliphilum]|uniref:Enoyl-CoA hydratase n=1 Tax=Marinospirillum alkaliphilum DSM 21637 TaxID=1122209 RepID=A0A1K1TC04_9GAMM|nr:enoyl-CoA hydratase-related protein [Marinospirillum alkaliphilum]SFW97869.1 enoyl-CoA hydratase [Marinospirillum alkaliphilum DSM 21637]
MAYEHILVETKGAVGVITLNRPRVYNALSMALIAEVGQAITAFERDNTIGCLLIQGSEKVFAAGADIAEMANKEYAELFMSDFPNLPGDGWDALESRRKPMIAAVSGMALGGGCELAMACDFILASETARFGQPEIKLATMPGAGGTQRLTRAIGKAKAMEMCLTGRMMDAAEAERSGLVSRVLSVEELFGEALKTAELIAAQSRPVTLMIREAVDQAYETSLAAGLKFERRAFQSSFAFEDRSEGMQAFVEKRAANFRHR